jgi:hypothetical protein
MMPILDSLFAASGISQTLDMKKIAAPTNTVMLTHIGNPDNSIPVDEILTLCVDVSFVAAGVGLGLGAAVGLGTGVGIVVALVFPFSVIGV